MKRGLGAALLVAAACTGQAGADYLRVKVDVKNATPYPAAANVQDPQGGIGAIGGARPPGFGKGGFVPPPVATQPSTPPATARGTEGDHIWVTAFLEIKGKAEYKGAVGAVKVIKLDHQFGKNTYVPIPPRDPSGSAPFLEVEEIKKEPLATEHDRRFKKLKDTDKAKDLVDLAFWDWSHGLMKQFHATMDELKKTDAKHPAVAAYNKIQNQLKTPAPGDDPAAKEFLSEMRSEHYRPVVSDKGRYVLFTSLPPGKENDAPIKRRLTRLEDSLETFYYWFALQNNVPVPAMPRHRLLGILINESGEFHKKHKSWGSQPMLGSGFTPHRDNILVLASKRLDDPYVALDTWTTQWMQQKRLETTELLNGEVWKRTDANSKPNALSFAIIQTMAVIQKAMEEEAERTTLTHQAVRQLLAASGLLPHNVVAPEWIQEGLAAYFERPFGAVYGAGGLPSWSNLVAFKHYRSNLGKGRDILTNVITDRYFQIARHASAQSGESRDKAEKARDDWERARASAWALVYYLDRHQQTDRLLGYANEIAQLPRDLELDQATLEGSFAKAFGLGDAKNAMRFDERRLQTFADTWLEYMKTVSLELPGEEVESMKTRKANAAPGAKKEQAPSKGKADTLPPPSN